MKPQSKESMKISEMTSEKNITCITVSFSTKKPMVYFGFEQKSTKAPQNRQVSILEATIVSQMESNMS